jgi:hypothetical protein
MWDLLENFEQGCLLFFLHNEHHFVYSFILIEFDI